MAKEVVLNVTISLPDNTNMENEMATLVESALNRSLGREVEEISVEEAGVEVPAKGGTTPRPKNPKEISDTTDWEDEANKEDAAKFAEKRNVIVAETQQVSKYMAEKHQRDAIIAYAESITDEQLPIFLKYASKPDKEAWKIEKATTEILIRRANEERF